MLFAICDRGFRSWEQEPCFRVLRVDYEVRIKGLTFPSACPVTPEGCYACSTLSGSNSGTTSEYPVCRATGRIARRELARCAAKVSENRIRGERPKEHSNIRDMAPQSLAYRHVQGISQRGKSENESECTFNFAIKVLSVSKNSPAVRCDVACWSSFCFTAEKSV